VLLRFLNWLSTSRLFRTAKRTHTAVSEYPVDQPSSPAHNLNSSARGAMLCPSFTPLSPGIGSIFGLVVEGFSSTRVVQLQALIPVTQETFDCVAPFHPSELFRIAAPCVGPRCRNYLGGVCTFGATVAARSGELTTLLPCVIRPGCRWWREQGPTACSGCSMVVSRIRMLGKSDSPEKKLSNNDRSK
jgi:hypothetical protein